MCSEPHSCQNQSGSNMDALSGGRTWMKSTRVSATQQPTHQLLHPPNLRRLRQPFPYLATHDGDRRGLPLALPLNPDRVPQGRRVNRSILAGLLGQDALRHFDLELCYNPPTVTLTEAAPA